MYGKVKSCLPKLKGVSVFVTILRIYCIVLYACHIQSHVYTKKLLYTAPMKSTIISNVYTTDPL